MEPLVPLFWTSSGSALGFKVTVVHQSPLGMILVNHEQGLVARFLTCSIEESNSRHSGELLNEA